MGKARLEAFSDGVIAIIITIMVLELRPPHGDDLPALAPLWPTLLSYVLSFLNVAIYWNNHHHLMHAVKKVNGAILWGNVHLLFWLSLVPFTAAWMGENHFAPMPVAVYGVVQLMAGVAYYILVRVLISHHGPDSDIAVRIGDDFKGKISLVIYIASISLSFVNNWIAFALIVAVAIMWLVPDRRFEPSAP